MIRRALLAAATAAALLLAAAPASAACPSSDWATRLRCAHGDIARQWVGEDDQGRPTTWLSGWIDPCGTPGTRERFGFVYYLREGDGPGQGYVFVSRLRKYGPDRTAFEGTIDPDVEVLNGVLIGVCLAYGPGKVVDCVQPLREPITGAPRPPLPPVEVMATLPVSLTAPGGTDPNCATCV